MRLTVWSAIALGVLGNVAVARAADRPDDRVETRVGTRLSHDARLKGQDVHVDVDDGVAKLKGKVATEADKARAEKVAAAVAGVKSVQNQLEVDPSVAKDRIEHNADKSKERIDENAKRAKERIDDNTARAKERVDESRRADRRADGTPASDRTAAPVERPHADNTGDQISDGWITTKVKGQFVGVDVLKGSDINVDTSKEGVVTLNGTVPTEAARSRAVEIARTTKGVRRVVDNLKLSK
jgi:hyperosmotically inducible protein